MPTTIPAEVLAPIGDSASATTTTATLTADAAASDGLVILVVASGSTISSVVDSQGTAYAAVGALRSFTGGVANIYFGQTATPLVHGVDTLKVTMAATAFKGLSAYKFDATRLVLDRAAGNSGQSTATPATGASGVLAAIPEFALAMFAWATDTTFGEPATYTNVGTTGQKIQTTTTVVEAAAAYKNVTVTTSINVSATLGVSETSCGLVATFQLLDHVAAPKLQPQFLYMRQNT